MAASDAVGANIQRALTAEAVAKSNEIIARCDVLIGRVTELRVLFQNLYETQEKNFTAITELIEIARRQLALAERQEASRQI